MKARQSGRDGQPWAGGSLVSRTATAPGTWAASMQLLLPLL